MVNASGGCGSHSALALKHMKLISFMIILILIYILNHIKYRSSKPVTYNIATKIYGTLIWTIYPFTENGNRQTLNKCLSIFYDQFQIT